MVTKNKLKDIIFELVLKQSDIRTKRETTASEHQIKYNEYTAELKKLKHNYMRKTLRMRAFINECNIEEDRIRGQIDKLIKDNRGLI